MKWADLDSDDSDDEEIITYDIQPAGLNDGTVQVRWNQQYNYPTNLFMALGNLIPL